MLNIRSMMCSESRSSWIPCKWQVSKRIGMLNTLWRVESRVHISRRTKFWCGVM
jgi:hypothetical protein